MAGTHTIVRLVVAPDVPAFVLKLTSAREAFVYRQRERLGLGRALPFGVPLTVAQCDRLLVGGGGQVSLSSLFEHSPTLIRQWSERKNKKIPDRAIDTLINQITDRDGRAVSYGVIKSQIAEGEHSPLLMENIFYGFDKDIFSVDVKIGRCTKSDIQYRYENPNKWNITVWLKLLEHWSKDNRRDSRTYGVDLDTDEIFRFLDFIRRPDVVGDAHRHLLVQQVAMSISEIKAAVGAAPATLVGASVNIIVAKKNSGDRYATPLVCLIDPDHPILNLGDRELPGLHDEAAAAGIVTDRNWGGEPRLRAIVGNRPFAPWFAAKKQEGFDFGIEVLRRMFARISERYQAKPERSLAQQQAAESVDMVVVIFEMSPDAEREFRQREAHRRAVANRPARLPSQAGDGRPVADVSNAAMPARRQSAQAQLPSGEPLPSDRQR